MPTSKFVVLTTNNPDKTIKQQPGSHTIPGKNSKKAVEELSQESTVMFPHDSDNYLIQARQVILNNIPVVEGMFRRKPCSSNSYALSNMISQLQSLENQLDAQTDWDEITREICQIISTVVESMVLELGRTIRRERGNIKGTVSNPGFKIIKELTDKIYRSYGSIVQVKLDNMKVMVGNYINS